MTDRADLAEILDGYLAALESGSPPDRDALLAKHPDLAEELQEALLGVDFVYSAAPRLAPDEHADAQPGRSLGDYRLLRELGRGGMAVVYEAEQVSLGRKVALKVLPFAAVLDPKQLQRFKNEALAAAHLHHANIVPVYGVGCERGVHYYAMQYVEGQSLATAIRDLKEGGTGEEPKTPISSHGSNREPAYIRMATTLGVQAAQALDHAHQLGIVHRDVKPGNLLVDHTGTLWVTDFGVASSVANVGLTMTGELLGTIRYMSPEQALAKRAPIDHRTDIYSLGATLYELFTLEPAFPGDDPHVVIHDIATKEPVLPRRLNPVIPSDLETVLLKAMSKEPANRYATALEMAEDLTRFLENRSIEAKRPGLVRRASMWGRRHRTLVGATAALLLLSTAGLATGTALLWREQAHTKAAYGTAQANLRLARNAVDKFLAQAGVAQFKDAPLPPAAKRALLEAALSFYETYGKDPASSYNRAGILHDLHRYADALAAVDRNLDSQPRDANALTVRGHMLFHLGRYDDALVALDRAIAIDPNVGSVGPHVYRGHVLAAMRRLADALAAHQEAVRIHPNDAYARQGLGKTLHETGDEVGAVREWREAVRLDPDDATARSNLGVGLRTTGDTDGAIEEYREAIRLQPDFAAAHTNFGNALLDKGDVAGAIRECRKAIGLQPDDAMAHVSLGDALSEMDDFDGAIQEYDEAIRLQPDHAKARINLAIAHNNLGLVLLENKGDVDGAIREHRETIRLDPDDYASHFNLGNALAAKGDLRGAANSYREAIRRKPDHAESHYCLGIALRKGGDPERAIEAYKEAIRIRSDYAEAYCNLGHALTDQARFSEALPWLRKGHELGSVRPDWDYDSARWIQSAERNAELEARLDLVLSGKAQPRDADERIVFARMLQAKARHAESARMFAEAFADDATLAEDLDASNRYNAACSAALAAAAGGADAAEWRGRALEWLRADLAAREKAATGLADTLEQQKKDPDFASVRDRLGDLPEPERDAWRGLWAAVDLALATALPTAK